MHEGHHDIAAEALARPAARRHHLPHPHRDNIRGDAHPEGRRSEALADAWTRYRPFAVPALLALLALLSWEGSANRRLGFDVAILAAAAGLAIIGSQTLVDVLRTRRIVAGVLVTVALVATAYVEEYRAAAIVAVMMLLGEALENLTLSRTRDAIRGLITLAPRVARVKHDDHFHEVPIERVRVGDVVMVAAGERVPVDGVVAAGHSAVDQSPITGESLPSDKVPGDRVFAGTMNLSGPLDARATAVGQDSTLGRIIDIVRRAQALKGPAQKLADRFAGWFTPTIAATTTMVYLLTGDLMRAVAVLVIACPCALVLATPTAVVASVGNSARRGALIKGGLTLELAGKVDTIVLDKTGTLTLGQPRVTGVLSFDGRTAAEVLRLAAALETRSRHPLARAIAQAAVEGEPAGEATEVREHPGRGVSGSVAGRRVLVGNRDLLRGAGVEPSPTQQAAWNEMVAGGSTAVWVVEGTVLVGAIAIGDTVREGSPELIRQLRALGIREIVMLTGDTRAVADRVAAQVGIDRVIAEVLPEDKAAVIQTLQAEGRTVAMVGDGINDAPALAVADVGIAMGAAGTDVAIEAADIALMGDDLAAIPRVLRISRQARRVIHQNIVVFAFLVNAAGIVLASAGVLSPIGAALVHNAASVAVVGNSARLLRAG